jgi:hypothetical protein
VVLYGCETWSLTLREEHRLRVFENRVLRRIFGPKRDEVTGEWRKLHNKELRDLCSAFRVIKSKRIRWITLRLMLERVFGVVWTGLICVSASTNTAINIRISSNIVKLLSR